MIRAFIDKLIPSKKEIWWERNFLIIVIVGALIFAAMSLAIGLHQSVWFDEAYSIMLAKQPAAQLVHLTSLDVHPPLYYLLLKGWASMFGWGEFALRSLSVIVAACAVVTGGLLVRRLFGTRAGLVALPFIVFAPFLLRYGFEIRMYALASLIGILATYVLVIAYQTKPGRYQWLLYAFYGVLVALGVYTLYSLAFLWVTHLAWLIWMTRRDKQELIKAPWVRAFALSILLFLPWLPAFKSQLGNGALAAISQQVNMDNLIGIISFSSVYQPTWQLNGVMTLVVLFAIVVMTFFTIRAFKVVSKKEKPYLILLAMYLLVPVILVTAISLVRPLYVERYLSHVVIGGYLFIGVITWLNLQKVSIKKWFVSGGLLAVMLIGVVQLAWTGNFNFQRLQTPTVKQAAASIPACDKGYTIFAADPYVAIELSYYLPNCQINFYTQWSNLTGGYAPLADSPLRVVDPARELSSSRKIYYVYYGQPESTMPSNLHQVSSAMYGAMTVAAYSAQ